MRDYERTVSPGNKISLLGDPFFFFFKRKFVLLCLLFSKQSPGCGPGIASRSVVGSAIMDKEWALVCIFDLLTVQEHN